jgi:aspartate/methionine/tyrosine aminotransferase
MTNSALRTDPMKYFQLRPLQAATISEISEATAASTVPEQERVNFHIGNPVQDERLKSVYDQLVLPQADPESNQSSHDKYPTVASENDARYRQLIYQAIDNSINYTPRGGFSRQHPIPLIHFIKKWLLSGQEEPLSYDFGEETGQRECIIVTGGIYETLRVIFQALSRYLIHKPAHILIQGMTLPEHLYHFPDLFIRHLNVPEHALIQELKNHLDENSERPTFLVIGSIFSETIRRHLRLLGSTQPLFFIEGNNSPNHLSLAREVQMLNRVLRIIFPAIFAEQLDTLTTGFLLGNAAYLRVIETVQFELKGTPAAAEMDHLNFLLTAEPELASTISKESEIFGQDAHPVFPLAVIDRIVDHYNLMAKKLNEQIDQKNAIWTQKITLSDRFRKEEHSAYLPHTVSGGSGTDYFSWLSPEDTIQIFFKQGTDLEFQQNLIASFLSVFLTHHPYYAAENCLVVPGSARTALSLLGFHCGIREVISVDLSWTYEHCFPRVDVVPLTPEFELDVDAIIQTFEKKSASNPHWSESAAFILNNPHNATGKIFAEDRLITLLRHLLTKNIYVIDDLSYQLVTPAAELSGPKTLRQLATGMARQGQIRPDHLQFLITVHSLSKTDCFAGARLAVVEIPHPAMFERFKSYLSLVRPNIMAVLLAYLFYRNSPEKVRSFWLLRNRIFAERMQALQRAVADFPAERNSFAITVQRPQGSMYPHLIINHLPSGLSLSWLASGLATRGIGLVPLSTFARTASGYEIARKTFRLTLGGRDTADILLRKMRRMLIDLNGMIAEETAAYNRSKIPLIPRGHNHRQFFPDAQEKWQKAYRQVFQRCQFLISKKTEKWLAAIDNKSSSKPFLEQYLPERMSKLQQRFTDRLEHASDLLTIINSDRKKQIIDILEQEFYKEDIRQRASDFRQRLFDRTVHPTQMYSLPVDVLSNRLIEDFLEEKNFPETVIADLAQSLVHEYFGQNVAIHSVEEADELVADIKCYISAEEYTRWNSTTSQQVLLSFWGDWDGSTRPSGQGHRLVAGVVVENVNQQAHILNTLTTIERTLHIPDDLQSKIQQLPASNRQLRDLLDKITLLTNQLEQRFRSFLPFNLQTSRLRRLAMSLHVARDPVKALWQHNDHLERRMVQLRQQRRELLEYYFALNKQLRKTLYEYLLLIQKNLNHPKLALPAGSFRSLLRRFVLTPRIHQNMITSSDQFAIDTTVHNMIEINEISGKYGNPALVLAIQVSMSSDPEALIALDRKLRSKREYSLRNNPNLDTPSVWLIPLFEDLDTVNQLDKYLDKLWEYAIKSRRLDQQVTDRFSEMICELFIAGSDLSQQVGQPAGADAFRRAKHQAVRWFAERGLVNDIRIKLGCGEPMQRQGGYYSALHFQQDSTFLTGKYAQKRLLENLSLSTRHSTHFARSPLTGIMAHRDLLTVQSNLAEQLKFIPVADLAQILYHLQQAQIFHSRQLQQISEPLQATRLQFRSRGLQELERLTCGPPDSIYAEFLKLLTQNFRQIIYGRDEDVVGIHVISYFVSRATPPLRDRPTVRPNPEKRGSKSEQLIERFAQILPLSRHGSLLRAIGHNKAQTMILGLNQLTTGIFRALTEFLNTQNSYSEAVTLISERILPRLPVYEILQTLRVYQDREMIYAERIEKCFPPGNSSFLAMREDRDAIDRFIPFFQKELLKRQGLDISDFFHNDQFKSELLPAIHPQYAVLLQPNIFNTQPDSLLAGVHGRIDADWYENLEPVLTLPEKIRDLRANIWKLLSDPIQQQVESFVQLALAVHSLITGQGWNKSSLSVEPAKIMRLSTQVSQSLRGVKDDGLRQFLISVVQYLTQMPTAMTELPLDIIRALQDVERIARIEEQVLSEKQQNMLRFYLLQMARWCGENG